MAEKGKFSESVQYRFLKEICPAVQIRHTNRYGLHTRRSQGLQNKE
jgi:hypothetical protein